MVEVRIPRDLEVYWQQVVKERYKGDEEAAALAAIVKLVESERREIVDDAKFDLAVKNINQRREKVSEISADEFSQALAKRQRRMQRARELFGKLGQDEDE